MNQTSILILGDILTLGLVTVLGFSTHGSLSSAGTRMLTTFIPLVMAWLLIAPHVGVFEPTAIKTPRNLWRPFWAMVLAAPMAAFLRGAWLNAPILPVFVVVLGGVSALSLLAWRGLYTILWQRRLNRYG